MNETMNGKSILKGVKDLDVYQAAFRASMDIFEISKKFPKEEIYSLTDQIRRASRSVCANLAELWSKRKYEAVFLNNLTDCLSEAAEAQTWLEFALKCRYMNEEVFRDLTGRYDHIYAMLKTMERMPEKFCNKLK